MPPSSARALPRTFAPGSEPRAAFAVSTNPRARPPSQKGPLRARMMSPSISSLTDPLETIL